MSKVILCADDSVTMQTVAEITFRTTEYAYVGARTTDEAIEKIKSQRPALVLADAVMPGKTGYDLCHALKSDPATADIPVVILCGNSAPYDGGRGGAAGADGSLTKPWDTQVMLDKVAEILDKVGASGVAKATGKPSAIAAAATGPSTTASTVPLGSVSTPAAIATPPAAPAQPKIAPPRSATIMGMPTIKMPGPAAGGPATPISVPYPATAAPVAPPTSIPPTSIPPTSLSPIAPPVVPPVAVVPPTVVAPPAFSAPRPAPAAPAAPTQAAASRPAGGGAIASFSAARAPMVSGLPTKRSAVVDLTLAKMGERLAELSGLTPGSPELTALVKLSSEVVERIVWEIVPELAETIIREHVDALVAKRAN